MMHSMRKEASLLPPQNLHEGIEKSTEHRSENFGLQPNI